MLRRRSSPLEPPSIRFIATPDTKWINKHARDVAQVLMAMETASEDKSLVGEGKQLAAEWVRLLPEDDRPNTGVVEAVLAVAAVDGLAIASLYPKDRPAPRPISEAVKWASSLGLQAAAQPLATAHIYACHAGHYLGREGQAARRTVIEGMDWQDALRTSPRAAVVADTMQQIWQHVLARS